MFFQSLRFPRVTTMLLVVLAVTLGLLVASPILNSPNPDAGLDYVEFPHSRSSDDGSLNEIFQEVEDLIKDTNTKLRNAVKELEAEDVLEDKVSLKDLPPNYHNETVKETKVGNATIVTKQEITKETDNKSGSTYISQKITSSLKSNDTSGHECIVDEDCRPGNYCHLSSFTYRCLPCKDEEPCARDGECCAGRLCVWGQCRTSSKGESGTICETRQDCGLGLCCAVHTSLLFPVCTPLPGKGEQCQPPNTILELFTWELESEIPVNFCPCPSGLVCQPQSHSLASICEDPSLPNTKREQPEGPEEDPSFYTPEAQDEIVYEDSLIAPTGLGLDLSTAEDFIDRESRLVPQLQLIDYI
ncbi:dickkopf-related protein 3 [Eleutherodactylus coqui]|uniref:dickkopf-related protein 3 n=1 Tax=Eleutherodactylus coqui TaxID=57060 RepID=UPI0034624369